MNWPRLTQMVTNIPTPTSVSGCNTISPVRLIWMFHD